MKKRVWGISLLILFTVHYSLFTSCDSKVQQAREWQALKDNDLGKYILENYSEESEE